VASAADPAHIHSHSHTPVVHHAQLLPYDERKSPILSSLSASSSLADPNETATVSVASPAALEAYLRELTQLRHLQVERQRAEDLRRSTAAHDREILADLAHHPFHDHQHHHHHHELLSPSSDEAALLLSQPHCLIEEQQVEDARARDWFLPCQLAIEDVTPAVVTFEREMRVPWAQVVACYWDKEKPVGRDHEVWDEHFQPSLPLFFRQMERWTHRSGRMFTRRDMCVLNNTPTLVRRYINVNDPYFIINEYSVVDPLAQTFEFRCYNEQCRDYVVALDERSFAAHPNNPQWTLMRQKSTIAISPKFGWVQGKVRDLAQRAYTKKANANLDLFEAKLKQMGLWQDE